MFPFFHKKCKGHPIRDEPQSTTSDTMTEQEDLWANGGYFTLLAVAFGLNGHSVPPPGLRRTPLMVGSLIITLHVGLPQTQHHLFVWWMTKLVCDDRDHSKQHTELIHLIRTLAGQNCLMAKHLTVAPPFGPLSSK